MARDLKAKIRLEADTKQANKALKSTTSQLGALAKNVLAPIAGFAALTKAVFVVTDSFVATERATAELGNALGSLGDQSEEAASALAAQATELARLTQFSTAEVTSAQARLAAFTTEKVALEALTKATLDLAVGRSIGLVEASEAIGKSFGTAANVLNEYGIVVNGATASTERLEDVTAGIASLWGGAAEAAADTFSGKVARLVENLTELAAASVGAATEQGILNRTLDKANASLENLSTELDEQPTRWEKIKLALQFVGRNFTAVGFAANTLKIIEDELNDELDETPPKLDAVADAAKRLNKQFIESQKEVDSVSEALKKLGVVLDRDTNKALDENAELLERTEVLYRDGAISRASFERAERGVAAEAERLKGILEGETGATEEVNSATQDLIETLRGLSSAYVDTADADGQFTQEFVSNSERRRAASSQERAERGANLLGGFSTFSQLSGGTFFDPAPVVVGPNGAAAEGRVDN
jgi:hypothetical protein